MVTMHVDSTLIDNYVSSGSLSGIDTFTTVYDQDGFPMMIYLDASDYKVKIVQRNPLSGLTNKIINLAKADQIDSFRAVQNYNTRAVFLVAYRMVVESDRTHGDYICYGPCSPTILISESVPYEKLRDFAFPNIHLGPLESSNVAINVLNWPCIVTTPAEKRIETARMRIANGQFVTLPLQQGHNPVVHYTLLDMKCARVNGQHGMWTLEMCVPMLTAPPDRTSYLQLNFWSHDHRAGVISQHAASVPEPRSFRNRLIPPSSHTRLVVVQGEDGLDRLLLIGSGLHLYSSADLFRNPTQISSEKIFDGVSDAYAVQHEDGIRLWLEIPDLTGRESRMQYCKISVKDLHIGLQENFQHAPMTDAHLQGKYAALPPIESQSYDQWFFYMVKDNSIMAASQCAETGLWSNSKHLFSLPDVTKIIHMQSYTSQVSFADDFPTQETREIRISSVYVQTAMVNGVKYTFGGGVPLAITVPVVLSITVVQETTDMVVRPFEVKDVATDKSVNIDAAAAAIKKLDLGNMTEQKLREHGADSTTNLDQAAEQLRNLATVGVKIDLHIMSMTTPLVSMGDLIEEGWHWIEQKGMKSVELAFDLAKSICTAIVRVGDWVRHLVIDSWHAIGRLARAILDSVKLGWDFIKKLAGEMFDWEKIMATTKNIHDSIVKMRDRTNTVLNNALDCLTSNLDGWLEGIEQNADSFLDQLAHQGNDSAAFSRLQTNQGDDHLITRSAKFSVLTSAFNSASEIQANDIFKPLLLTPDDALKSSLDKLGDIIKDTSLMDRLHGLSSDIANLFTAPLTGQSLIKVLKDILHIGLKLAKEVVHGFVNFFRTFVHDLLSNLDKPIEIPIITPLLRWVARSEDGFEFPSPFMIVSFFMAVIYVETHALGVTKWGSETGNFDAAATLPDATAMSTSLEKWSSSHLLQTLTTANTTPHMMVMGIPSPSEAWSGYAPVSAAAHPLLLGAQMMLSALSGPTSIYRIVKYAKPNLTLPQKWMSGSLGAVARCLDAIEAALSVVDLFFTFPPFESVAWPAWAFNMGGYGLSAVNAIITLVNTVLISKPEAVELGLAVVTSALTVSRVGLVGHAIHEQINSADDAWSHPEQHDKAMAELHIGNITCEGAGALGQLTAALGAYYLGKDPESAPIRGTAVIIGIVLDRLSIVSDWSVDVVKSDKEYKENRKSYVGASRR